MQSFDNNEPGRNNSSATGPAAGTPDTDATEFIRTPDSGTTDYSTMVSVGAPDHVYAGPHDAPDADDFGDDVSDDRSGSSDSGQRFTGFLDLRRRLPHLTARDVRRHLPYAAAATVALIALVIGAVVATDSRRNEMASNVVASDISETSSGADPTTQIGALSNVVGISETPNDVPVPDDATAVDTLDSEVAPGTGTITGESTEATASDPSTMATDTPTSTSVPGPSNSSSVSVSGSFSVQVTSPLDASQTAQPDVSPRQDPITTTTAPVTVAPSGTTTLSTSPSPNASTTTTNIPTTTQTVPATTSTVPTTTTSIGRTTTPTSAKTMAPSGKPTTTSARHTPTAPTITKSTEREPVPPPSQPTFAYPLTTTPHQPTAPTAPKPMKANSTPSAPHRAK